MSGLTVSHRSTAVEPALSAFNRLQSYLAHLNIFLPSDLPNTYAPVSFVSMSITGSRNQIMPVNTLWMATYNPAGVIERP